MRTRIRLPPSRSSPRVPRRGGRGAEPVGGARSRRATRPAPCSGPSSKRRARSGSRGHDRRTPMATDDTAPLSDADVERLYDAPLDSFVSERTALVKRLREAGARDAAARANALRKPTVPAWAVDQLARRHPEDGAPAG